MLTLPRPSCCCGQLLIAHVQLSAERGAGDGQGGGREGAGACRGMRPHTDPHLSTRAPPAGTPSPASSCLAMAFRLWG